MANDILQEQIAYYRARAGEYDEWFYRNGRYDQGEVLNRQWFDEAAQVMEVLHGLGPVERALELACGTGIWTAQLVKIAAHITAIDVSPEVIAINRQKLNAANVSYRQRDVFEWEPEDTYDLVLFGFWLSHVPPDQQDSFLDKVRRALKPGGQVFMVDSRPRPSSTANDQVISGDDLVMTRRLNDGREFQIIKIYWEADDLEAVMNRNGLSVEAGTTANYFIYAHGSRQ